MPLDQTSAQKATTQTGIKDPSVSIPSPQGVTSSSYPTQTPPSTASTTAAPHQALSDALTPPQSTAAPAQSASNYPQNSQISAWRQSYDNAVKSIPPDVQAQLDQLSQQAKQWDARNPGGVGPQGMGNPFEANYQTILDKYLPQQYQQIQDALANNMLAVDKNGNFYDPNKATGFDAFMEEAVPIALAVMGAAVGGELLGAIGTGASTAATTTAVEAATTTTGEVAASTAAAGEAAAATSTAAATTAATGAEVAGTLDEIVVTGTSTLGAGSAAEAVTAIGGLGAGVSMTGGTASGGMPAVNSPAPQGFKQYLPKNMISSGLQKAGVNATAANIIGGAGQGGIFSAIRGQNVWKGILSGGVATGLSEGLSAFESSTGALDPLGNAGIKAFNATVANAGTAAVLGGDPLKAGAMGFAGSVGGSVLSNSMGSVGGFDVGTVLGSTAGQLAMSSILGVPKQQIPNPQTGRPTATNPATSPNSNTAQPGGVDLSGYTFPTTPPQPVTYPTAPFSGVGYGYGGGGVSDSADSGSYWGDDQEKLKRLLAALQTQG